MASHLLVESLNSYLLESYRFLLPIVQPLNNNGFFVIHTVTINDVPFSCFDAGEGHVLLFVHGFPLDHTMWSAQLDFFQQGYRVIAPDLRGFGKSGGADDLLTMEQLADDLNSLLDALEIDEPITLCGLSMGGYIAFQFALKYPERLARLILCDTKAAADSQEVQMNREVVASQVLEEGPQFLVEGMIEKLFAVMTGQTHPEIVKQIREVIKNSSPLAVAGASRGMGQRIDAQPHLAQFEVPSLVLCGSEDVITPPEEMEKFSRKMPQAEYHTIPGAGHMAPLEKPEVVNNLIQEFLSESDA